MPRSDDPEHDLDASSYSLVKPCPGGKHGTTHPDMAWEGFSYFVFGADSADALAPVAAKLAGHSP